MVRSIIYALVLTLLAMSVRPADAAPLVSGAAASGAALEQDGARPPLNGQDTAWEQGRHDRGNEDWQHLTVWRDLPPVHTPAPRPAALRGRRVLLLWNGKHNSDIILKYFAEQLRTVAGVHVIDEQGCVQYLSIPHGKEEAEQGVTNVVVCKPDLVVMGMGDCRVCAAWLAVQACMMEERGIPTVALLTRPFYKTYRNVCQNMRMAPLTVLTTPHPVAAISTVKVRAKAGDLFNQFWCLFPQSRSTRH